MGRRHSSKGGGSRRKTNQICSASRDSLNRDFIRKGQYVYKNEPSRATQEEIAAYLEARRHKPTAATT